MEHSHKFFDIKRWYDYGMWNDVRVDNAVKMGWLTQNEADEIKTSHKNSDILASDN